MNYGDPPCRALRHTASQSPAQPEAPTDDIPRTMGALASSVLFVGRVKCVLSYYTSTYIDVGKETKPGVLENPKKMLKNIECAKQNLCIRNKNLSEKQKIC